MAPQERFRMADKFTETLFEPILQSEHFKVFHDRARATLGSLYEGLLLNVHEVEASLIAKNHVRFCLLESGFGETHLAYS